jgi:hypothetical protein
MSTYEYFYLFINKIMKFINAKIFILLLCLLTLIKDLEASEIKKKLKKIQNTSSQSILKLIFIQQFKRQRYFNRGTKN